ncbi:hypothetical protein TRIATDRAFT_301254 [Trichoderma atroviride IMI 206040]|uniref:Uncharacterized protein n=1 Tax=Hypocrea atroviridis (strain ATCC 20476 / IMI 206040) TaxID=452589 RepID=G9P205_HYPAI|nr:uncharacterized protein TRIATDRAFT_301254 [Trichoderma atroviride IMI 206040]EHK43431.1 hypothetical protein TRIATDRAFT_301254 [Trichoderma atroviride IMI 206040]
MNRDNERQRQQRDNREALAARGWGGLQTQVDDIEIGQGRLVAANRSGSKTAVFKTEYQSG